jgi:beta-glucosidase
LQKAHSVPFLDRASRVIAGATWSAVLLAGSTTHSQTSPAKKHMPQAWDDQSLSADQWADLVLKQLTLDEKISLLHGSGMPGFAFSPEARDSTTARG